MSEIEFLVPGKEHEALAKAYIDEHLANNEDSIHGGALIEKMNYDDWLNQVRANSDQRTVEKSWVVSSTFFAVRKQDRKIIGMVDIRHDLNDFLKSYGGNIGVGVRPSERGKGYGREILRMSLEYSQSIGLKRVMVACYKDNHASRSIILHCGGVLEREFRLSDLKNPPFEGDETDDKIVQVFWVNL